MNTQTLVSDLFGMRRLYSEADLVRAIEGGFSSEVVQRFVDHGLEPKEVFRIIGAQRTIRRRLAQAKPLTREESDRAARLARVLGIATWVFGDIRKALRWLRKPKEKLDPDRPGTAPIELLSTEHGARLVEHRLRQIEHGMFA